MNPSIEHPKGCGEPSTTVKSIVEVIELRFFDIGCRETLYATTLHGQLKVVPTRTAIYKQRDPFGHPLHVTTIAGELSVGRNTSCYSQKTQYYNQCFILYTHGHQDRRQTSSGIISKLL